MPGAQSLNAAFMVVQSNSLDELRSLVISIMRRYPLAPLENEIALVQSNGIAQWLKLALAEDPEDDDLGGCGIAAAIDVQLPGSFMWQLYRMVLGRDEIPVKSLLDKAPLTWRLMRLLPQVIDRPHFEPLQRFLTHDTDLRKRYQLSERLADLFDQYQVYRADWLEDWAEGRHQLRNVRGEAKPLPPTNCWQAELWRALLVDVGEQGMAQSRAGVHQRFIERINNLDEAPAGLPSRVIVFGISSLPAQALKRWPDLPVSARFCCACTTLAVTTGPISSPTRICCGINTNGKRARAACPSCSTRTPCISTPIRCWLHGASKVGTTSICSTAMTIPTAIARLFAMGASTCSATRSQRTCSINCRMTSLNCVPSTRLANTGRRLIWNRIESIRFHIAHSAQREVEILHDQLLARFSANPDLRPRDVIVMVPDIDSYAPHIRAVFGQLDRHDPRFIPFTLADQGQRGRDPLLIAVEHLLKLPDSRFPVSEILDLLDVPALRARFGVEERDLPTLHRWIEGAGVRWGMNAEQRAGLGLPKNWSKTVGISACAACCWVTRLAAPMPARVSSPTTKSAGWTLR
jgi:exodeoxyribonuclease V gamma subunit